MMISGNNEMRLAQKRESSELGTNGKSDLSQVGLENVENWPQKIDHEM